MTTHGPSEVARLRRVRTGARATLVLGIGASLAANVLAADPSIAGRVIAAWSPIALLLTVELLSRVPATPGRLSRLRVGAASTIAAIAAWVSYWHMVEVAQIYGEATVAAHLLPFSVDGLVVVASVCLVEISDRIAGTPSPSGRSRGRGGATSKAPSLTTSARPEPRSNGSHGDTVRRLAAEHPHWSQAELADAAGCSVRTVRRHLSTQVSDPHATSAKNATGPREEVSA